jgi:hypothetical protein
MTKPAERAVPGRAMVAVALGAFVAGVGVGRVSAPPSVARVPDLLSQVPGDELVEVLALVERNHSTSPTDLLTYPALGAPGEARVPTAAPAAAGLSAVVAPVLTTSPPKGWPPPPPGAFTVEVAAEAEPVDGAELVERLAGQGLPVWAELSLVGGRPRVRVAVGGGAEAEELEALREQVVAAGLDAASATIVPMAR